MTERDADIAQVQLPDYTDEQRRELTERLALSVGDNLPGLTVSQEVVALANELRAAIVALVREHRGDQDEFLILDNLPEVKGTINYGQLAYFLRTTRSLQTYYRGRREAMESGKIGRNVRWMCEGETEVANEIPGVIDEFYGKLEAHLPQMMKEIREGDLRFDGIVSCLRDCVRHSENVEGTVLGVRLGAAILGTGMCAGVVELSEKMPPGVMIAAIVVIIGLFFVTEKVTTKLLREGAETEDYNTSVTNGSVFENVVQEWLRKLDGDELPETTEILFVRELYEAVAEAGFTQEEMESVTEAARTVWQLSGSDQYFESLGASRTPRRRWAYVGNN